MPHHGGITDEDFNINIWHIRKIPNLFSNAPIYHVSTLESLYIKSTLISLDSVQKTRKSIYIKHAYDILKYSDGRVTGHRIIEDRIVGVAVHIIT